jgi:hypothetical protein
VATNQSSDNKNLAEDSSLQVNDVIMKPELRHLFLSRDVITDSISKEISAIRIFDTVVIPKGWVKPYFYSFYCVGRVFLNTTGMVKSITRVKICDPTGQEIRTVPTSEGLFNAEYGINFTLLVFAIPFSQEGKYTLQASTNINGGEFVDIGEPHYLHAVDAK